VIVVVLSCPKCLFTVVRLNVIHSKVTSALTLDNRGSSLSFIMTLSFSFKLLHFLIVTALLISAGNVYSHAFIISISHHAAIASVKVAYLVVHILATAIE
jgi:hypothetical protein